MLLCACVYLLNKVLDKSGVGVMADSQYTAQTRVQVLLEFLHERHMDLVELSEIKRSRLDQAVQLCQFNNDASQVNIFFLLRIIRFYIIYIDIYYI